MAVQILTTSQDNSDIFRPAGRVMIQVNTSDAVQRFILQQANGAHHDDYLLDSQNAGEWADATARTDEAVFSSQQRVCDFHLSAGFAYRLLRYAGPQGATAYLSDVFYNSAGT